MCTFYLVEHRTSVGEWAGNKEKSSKNSENGYSISASVSMRLLGLEGPEELGVWDMCGSDPKKQPTLEPETPDLSGMHS